MLPFLIAAGELIAEIAVPALIGGAVGAGGVLLTEVIVEKVQGLITKAKAKKKLQEMNNFLKAEIKSKSHKHISLSAYTIDGETQEIKIEGDGVADDIDVGDYIYV